MTSALRNIKMPNAGIFNEDGTLNKAGHHFLEQLQLIAPALADIQDQLDGLPGGTLGALSGLDTLDRPHLAAGFGLIEIANTELAALTTLGTYTTAVPADDTIPQVTEGDQALSGTYAPISATSQLRVRFEGTVGCDAGGARAVAISLYQGAGTDAIGSTYVEPSAGFLVAASFEVWVPSPGAGVATTFSLRVGPGTGTAYLNGTNTFRFLGGALRSSLRLSEFETH